MMTKKSLFIFMMLFIAPSLLLSQDVALAQGGQGKVLFINKFTDPCSSHGQITRVFVHYGNGKCAGKYQCEIPADSTNPFTASNLADSPGEIRFLLKTIMPRYPFPPFLRSEALATITLNPRQVPYPTIESHNIQYHSPLSTIEVKEAKHSPDGKDWQFTVIVNNGSCHPE
jgi:hypothetical protein